MSTKFSQHGTFSNRTEGPLLISEVVGPWNIELVTNLAKDSYPMAVSLAQNGPWVYILLIEGSLLCPPEAMAEMKRINKYAATHLGVVANLLVADNATEGYLLMHSHYTKLYGEFSIYRSFTTLEEAKSFAEEVLRDPSRVL